MKNTATITITDPGDDEDLKVTVSFENVDSLDHDGEMSRLRATILRMLEPLQDGMKRMRICKEAAQ